MFGFCQTAFQPHSNNVYSHATYSFATPCTFGGFIRIIVFALPFASFFQTIFLSHMAYVAQPFVSYIGLIFWITQEKNNNKYSQYVGDFLIFNHLYGKSFKKSLLFLTNFWQQKKSIYFCKITFFFLTFIVIFHQFLMNSDEKGDICTLLK